MVRYITRRLLWVVPVFLLVSVGAFSLLSLIPGDPAVMVLGEQATPEMLQDFRTRFDLDKPYVLRLAGWMGGVIQGDLGRSWRTNETVAQMIVVRLPVTIQLTLMSMLIAVLFGIPAGILSAVRRNSMADTAATFLSVLGMAMPYFFLGILLIYLFAYQLRWLPPAGFQPLLKNPWANFRHMLLPSLALGGHLGAVVMRQTRSSMLDVLGQEYIRTARAKGVAERVVNFRHALKNAAIPVVTVIGLQTGHLFGGAVITETLFALPGIGRLVVTGVTLRDYMVVQGVVLMTALVVLLTNLIVDVIYAYMDPRIRHG